MPTSGFRAIKSSALDPVFLALRKMFQPHIRKFNVMHDTDQVFYLECRKAKYKNKPMFVGGVRRGKSYVSVYLMPIYCYPEMIGSISPELKKRLGGKACFNFKKIEPGLFDELSILINKGLARFAAVKDFETEMQGRTYI